MKRTVLAACALVLLWIAAPAAQEVPAPPFKWYKGNIHAHTLNSDGDSTPLEVASWYREHGYQFLTLSDHNYITQTAPLNPVIGAAERFLLIQGEEITSRFNRTPIHVNAIGLGDSTIPPQTGSSVADVLQKAVSAIHAKGAMPSVNHPNFGWAMTADDLASAKGLTHFEIYNSNPGTNSFGGGDSPSVEAMWDTLLTAGKRVYGVAVDDAHFFKPGAPNPSKPGGGWVMVRSESLDAGRITDALRGGEFYATSGVLLDSVQRGADGLSIQIKTQRDFQFTTTFIGTGGKVLARDTSMKPSYKFQGNEAYVRARIQSSEGDYAWTQPAFRSAAAQR